MCVCVCVCVCVCACVYIHIPTRIHTYLHTYMIYTYKGFIEGEYRVQRRSNTHSVRCLL